MQRKIKQATIVGTVLLNSAVLSAAWGNDYCCYHGESIWLESDSAQSVRNPDHGGQINRLRLDQIDQGNPWRSGGDRRDRQGRPHRNASAYRIPSVAGAYPAAYGIPLGMPGNGPDPWGTAWHELDAVPLGLFGPVDPFFIGSGWPFHPGFGAYDPWTGGPYSGWGPGPGSPMGWGRPW